MPMLLGAKGKDILQWRACQELVTSFEETLARRWSRASAAEAESLLETLMERLKDEVRYEEGLSSETATLDNGIGEASSTAELKPLLTRYRELIAAHFSRRHSVLALFDICNQLHDSALAKAVSLATGKMRELGQGDPPRYALLVSGDRARREQTLQSQNRYLILHEQESERFFLFNRQLALALKETGLLKGEQMLWHGSPADLRRTIEAAFSLRQRREQKIAATPLLPFTPSPQERPQDVPDWEWHVEVLTDLIELSGDAALAGEGVQAAASLLAEIRQHGPFLQLARRVIALPLAIGRFGRWRLLRDGEHQGEIDLEASALAPLVMAIRILAISAGVTAGGTLQRIEALLGKGVLSVELAERLLKALHCFMQARILSEIRSGVSGAFSNPEELTEAEEERLRASVETVLNLQKIAYQRMIGQV
jgi:CBS domain-containing protein